MLRLRFFLVTLGLLVLWASPASAELLALLNYESKPGQPVRREGIAIMEIDPESADFGKILMDIPLPSDLVAHHIFFNRDKSKAYITSLGKSVLLAIDLTRFPYRLRTIDVPDCQVNEDLVVSEDNKTWFLTCMGSSNVVMGDAQTDRPIKTISSSDAAAFILYPHGIAIHNGIDRVLVTSTVKPDMSDQGDTVTVLEAKTGKVLSTHQVASKPTPAKSAPVEVMFSPNSTPPRGAHYQHARGHPLGRDLGSEVESVHVRSGRRLRCKGTGDAVGDALQQEGRPPLRHHGQNGIRESL